MSDYHPGGFDEPGLDADDVDDGEHGYDEGDYDGDDEEPTGGRRRSGGERRSRRQGRGCLPALIGLLVVGLLVGFGVWKGLAFVKDKLSGPEDYAGPGHGKVLFEVHEGDIAAEIGRNLKAAGVVKSVDAFIAEASAEPRSANIQVGTYQLKKEMSAKDALEVLIDPDNLVQNLVTIPEGLRVVDIVDLLVKKTDVPRADFDKWLAKADKLGLPDYAGGNPEGYLFPATYDVGPNPTAKKILTQMIERWQQAADEAGLEEAATQLGKTPEELMTIASLVQAEGRGDDMPKVARVIYNRLDGPGDKGGTYGLLQIDAAVNYALDRKGVITLTQAEIDSVADSPYNTYKVPGLPPTPIAAPGDAAIAAATHPADGPWFFYVTVNLRTGETKFTDNYDEFLQFKAEKDAYCETSDAC